MLSIDKTDHGYRRWNEDEWEYEKCERNDEGAERYLTCSYCGRSLRPGESCSCEASKW